MHKHKKIFRFAFILIIIISFLLCPFQGGLRISARSVSADGIHQAFTYVPQLTPIQYQTEVPNYLATLGAFSGLIELDDDTFYRPTYLRMNCRSIEDDVCFGICFAETCEIYGNDDDRVSRFIDLVDKREEKIREFELLQAEKGSSISDSLGTCLKAGSGAGLSFAAIVGITAPEPTITKLLGALAAGGALIVCGSSIYSAWRVEGLKQDQIIDEIMEATKDAVFEFQSLQEDPP